MKDAVAIKLVIWGARGHARVLTDLAAQRAIPVLFFGDRDAVPSPVDGIPVHQGREAFAAALCALAGPVHYAIAIGGGRGRDRLEIADWLESLGALPLTLRHPSAVVEPSARIEDGAQLLALSFVGAGACVGRQTILNTRASLDHDSCAAAGVHLAPGVTICGESRIGEGAFIAAGATVLPRLTIGADAVVGAGSVVVRDVAHGASVLGVPARPREMTA